MELKNDYLIMSLLPKKYGFDTILMNIPLQLINLFAFFNLFYLLSFGGKGKNLTE